MDCHSAQIPTAVGDLIVAVALGSCCKFDKHCRAMPGSWVAHKLLIKKRFKALERNWYSPQGIAGLGRANYRHIAEQQFP